MVINGIVAGVYANFEVSRWTDNVDYVGPIGHGALTAQSSRWLVHKTLGGSGWLHWRELNSFRATWTRVYVQLRWESTY